MPLYTSTTPFLETFTPASFAANWTISTWTAPGNNEFNSGVFSPAHAYISNGCLVLKLDQSAQLNGSVLSTGGEVASKHAMGYGTYKIRARASSTSNTVGGVGSPVSGSITGIFNYLPGSETEIDIEFEGLTARQDLTQLTSWTSDSLPNQHTGITLSGTKAYHTLYNYTIIWQPGRIRYYRGRSLIATHTTVVPTKPAPFMLNHWGTHNLNWGGLSTVNKPRYMFVDTFEYIPA